MGNTLSRTAGWAVLGFLSACGEADDPFVPIEPNRDPVAAIAADALGERGAVIDLDASGSHDPDGDALTYSWSFVSRPATSTATIGAAGPEQASFVPDALGTYVVRLELSDGAASATDDHSIVIDIPRLRGGTISTDSTIPNTSAPPEEPDYRVSANHTLTIVADVTIEPGIPFDFNGQPAANFETTSFLVTYEISERRTS